MASKPDRTDRMTRVLEAIHTPEGCIGTEGISGRIFRLLAGDMMHALSIEPAQLAQLLREFSHQLNTSDERQSSTQQEFSNLLAAWVNPTMPLPRMIQAMGAFGAHEVEITVTAKTGVGNYARTLSVPVPIVMKQNKSRDGVVYNVPYTTHAKTMANMQSTVEVTTEPEKH